MSTLTRLGTLAVLVLMAYAANTIAQNAATQPAAQSDQSSAEQVLSELLERREENPLIEPARPKPPATRPPARTLGSAPDADQATLIREGQFLLRRRGRLIRSTEGMAGWLYAFDADSDGLQDPPMFLMPCKLLEDMELIVEEQGEDAAFILSGKVFVYRNANYLLPTMMTQAPPKGNLQP